MVSRTSSLPILAATICILLMASTAIAAVSVTTSADYRGGQEGNDQGIRITYTLSPVDNPIEDVQINVRGTADTFIDFNSFERTVNPAPADVDIEYTGQGVYEIDRLEPNEEVTLRFTVYPKDIQREEIDAAVVDADYTQEGQTLEETTRVSADLSDSPWFKYLTETTSQDGSGGGILNIVFGLMVGVAIGGLLMYFRFKHLQ